MKHLTTALMTLILLGFSLFSFAEGKIAVVDFEAAVFNTDRVQAAAEELQENENFKKNMEQAKKIQEEGAKLVERLKKEAPTMSDEQKKKAEAEMKSKQADLEHVARKINDAKEAALKPLMYEINIQAMSVAKEIVDSEGIGLLLNASKQAQMVLHADTSYDISAKVTDKLNKLHAQKK